MKSKNSFLYIFLIALFFINLNSCSKRYDRIRTDSSIDQIGEIKARPKINVNDEFQNKSESLEDKFSARKIIFNAYLSLKVKNPDSTNIKIEAIAKKYNGYINTIGTYNTIIRVKSDQLEKALDEISTLGKIKNKRINGLDVTATYLDYEIRLENAEKTRNRYLELLDKAVTVEEILKVELQLERLNEKIDLLKGQMNRINHLDEFSTITINLEKKKKPGVLGYIGIGLYKSVKWLFVRN